MLAALLEAPEAERDVALLAHHAEAAGDREAMLEFAIAAAEQAAALHAHREAAAQYARALRFADRLLAAERARLFEGHSVACCLIDRGDEAVAARQAALDIWRSLGDPLKEGENLRWLSYTYWLQGRGAETEAAAIAALDLLEPLPPGPELAMAYSNLAQLRMLDNDLDETLLWGNRAIALAEQLGETETLVHALANVGTMRLYAEDEGGEEELTRSVDLALDSRLFDYAGRALTLLALTSLSVVQLDKAERQVAAAIAFAIEHDLDFRRGYLLATQAALRARQGAWDAAEAESRQVLRQPMVSPVTRMVALTTLGQVRARRGRPEAAAALDEALALAVRDGKLTRLAPVRAACADAALLAGDPLRARAHAEAVRDLIFARGNRWQRGEIAWLLWQVGERDVPTDSLADPYTLQIAGDFAAAAAAWGAAGLPVRRGVRPGRERRPRAGAPRSRRPSSDSGRSPPLGVRSAACGRSGFATCRPCGADPAPRPGQPGRADRTRGGGARVAGGRASQPGNRRAALPHPEYRPPSRLGHPRQAGRRDADRGGSDRGQTRPHSLLI